LSKIALWSKVGQQRGASTLVFPGPCSLAPLPCTSSHPATLYNKVKCCISLPFPLWTGAGSG
jgi:hypothetical protein